MPEQNGGYFRRSWAMLTKDRGWIKPVLVMSVASFVPFVGLIGVHGYALEWARLTAWGVDAAPKQKGVRVGECLRSGWRALVAGIGYTLVGVLLSNVLQTMLGNSFFVQLICMLVTTIAGVVSSVAALRATIYQEAGAGYQFDRMLDMIRADYQGLLSILLIQMAMSLVVVLATTGLSMMLLMPLIMGAVFGMPSAQLYALETLDSTAVRLIFFETVDAIASLAPWFAIIAFVAAFGTTMVTLIGTTAVGLWMRQFDVPAWGASDDPLPVVGGLPAPGMTTQDPYAARQGSVQPVPQQVQPMPQQAAQGEQVELERVVLTPLPTEPAPSVDNGADQPTTVLASQPQATAPTQAIAPTASPVQTPQAKRRTNAWFDATASAANTQVDQPVKEATPKKGANAWFDATASAGLGNDDAQE